MLLAVKNKIFEMGPFWIWTIYMLQCEGLKKHLAQSKVTLWLWDSGSIWSFSYWDVVRVLSAYALVTVQSIIELLFQLCYGVCPCATSQFNFDLCVHLTYIDLPLQYIKHHPRVPTCGSIPYEAGRGWWLVGPYVSSQGKAITIKSHETIWTPYVL